MLICSTLSLVPTVSLYVQLAGYLIEKPARGDVAVFHPAYGSGGVVVPVEPDCVEIVVDDAVVDDESVLGLVVWL
jgi:hypothetical protein